MNNLLGFYYHLGFLVSKNLDKIFFRSLYDYFGSNLLSIWCLQTQGSSLRWRQKSCVHYSQKESEKRARNICGKKRLKGLLKGIVDLQGPSPFTKCKFPFYYMGIPMSFCTKIPSPSSNSNLCKELFSQFNKALPEEGYKRVSLKFYSIRLTSYARVIFEKCL